MISWTASWVQLHFCSTHVYQLISPTCEIDNASTMTWVYFFLNGRQRTESASLISRKPTFMGYTIHPRSQAHTSRVGKGLDLSKWNTSCVWGSLMLPPLLGYWWDWFWSCNFQWSVSLIPREFKKRMVFIFFHSLSLPPINQIDVSS